MVPGFLADYAQLDQQCDTHFQMDLLHRVVFRLEQLFELRLRWEEEHSATVWESKDVGDQSLRKSIHFSTAVGASEIMLYNAVLLWLLGLLWKLDPVNPESAVSQLVLVSLLYHTIS